MTVDTTGAGPLGRFLRLFDPGQRLGWVYRDPQSLRTPFTEPEPTRTPPPTDPHNRVEAARLDHRDRRTTALWAGGGTVAASGALAYLVDARLAAVGAAAVVLAAAGLSRTARRLRSATASMKAGHAAHEESFQAAWQAWQRRRQYHEAQQEQWVRTASAWNGLPLGADSRRLDVFGGSPRGREGLLTVLGASTLRERPLIVLDLTQALICRELSVVAEATGVPVDVQLLPSRLAESNIVDGLGPHEMVHILVEAMHGDHPEARRVERAVDTRILTQVCTALGPDVTLARLGAGLRVLMGEDDESGLLDRAERRRIADDLLNDRNKEQARDSVFRLMSFVHPLEGLGTARAGRGPGYLTCIALDFGAGSASTELLADLAVQSVTRRLTTFPEAPPAVVVALGEQGLQRRHLEQLSLVCERRGSQLMLLHPHLRDAAEQMIGGGTVAFMRLGNHREATVAADFLGRHHSFVLHSLTDTEGRTVNTSIAQTIGTSVSTSASTSASVSTGTNWGDSRTYQGGFNPLSTGRSASSGGSHGETTGTSDSVTHGTNEAATRTTGDSDSTSRALGQQRVYEYALEPTQLQALAEFSLLVVEREPGGAVRVHSADCNPHIVLREDVETTTTATTVTTTTSATTTNATATTTATVPHQPALPPQAHPPPPHAPPPPQPPATPQLSPHPAPARQNPWLTAVPQPAPQRPSHDPGQGPVTPP
jgi:hypothetical protein